MRGANSFIGSIPKQGRGEQMGKRQAQQILQCSEGVEVALRYLAWGHPDLAMKHLEVGLIMLEDLAGGEAQTLRVAQRFLLDGQPEMGRAWLAKGLADLKAMAKAEVEGGMAYYQKEREGRKAQAEAIRQETQERIRRRNADQRNQPNQADPTSWEGSARRQGSQPEG